MACVTIAVGDQPCRRCPLDWACNGSFSGHPPVCLMWFCPSSLSDSGCCLPQQACILLRIKGMWIWPGAHGGIMISGLVFCTLHGLLMCIGCVSLLASISDRSCALAAAALATMVVAMNCVIHIVVWLWGLEPYRASITISVWYSACHHCWQYPSPAMLHVSALLLLEVVLLTSFFTPDRLWWLLLAVA